uniref:Uncharacterized protein n=1 Tax=Anguilla anguilla TaxID=7936 RepID=A0A0E9WRS2_ANGAN
MSELSSLIEINILMRTLRNVRRRHCGRRSGGQANGHSHQNWTQCAFVMVSKQSHI